ncbi:LEM-3-like GIY-YIG domain-containing protein [Helcococcus ovis]|uniref:LEM-3-like GIY-YIG domain-containing protein n=1 Tax=Helcococcus ovis TaxID=72026 RepID=UPI0038BD57CD
MININQIIRDVTGATKGEKDKYYVYALFEKGKRKPFYIGKGQNSRIFQHSQDAKNIKKLIENGLFDEEKMSLKIKKIIDNNGEIEPVIVKFGLTNEEAFATEAALISLLDYISELDLSEKLTNIVRGHGSNREKRVYSKDNLIKFRTVENFIYNYEISDFDFSKIKHKCVFIKINSSYKSEDTKEKTYENVRGVWNLSKSKMENVEYAVALYRGICVGVYPISGWKKAYDQSEEYPFPREKDNVESVLVRYSDIEELKRDRPDIFEEIFSMKQDPQKTLTIWRNKYYFYSDPNKSIPKDLKKAINKRIINIPKKEGGYKDINSRSRILYNF